MENDLAQEAISAALAGNWKKAVVINKTILKADPKEVDALNRLARAYSETGKIGLAKKTCRKVLKIDPINTIAEKSLSRWKGLRKGTAEEITPASPNAFLEEPGKTKLVDLLHPGAAVLLARLDAGDEVKLVPHAHRVNVITFDGKYIGRLPDDLAARLRRLTTQGYQYQIFVKSVRKKETKVFIREVKRGESSEGSSFPPEKGVSPPFLQSEPLAKLLAKSYL